MKKSRLFGLLAISGALALGAVTFSSTKKKSDNVDFDGGVFARKLTKEEIEHPIYAEPFEVYDSLATDNAKYKNGAQDCSMSILGQGTDMNEVWNAYRGDDTTIAIIDTGIDYDHPDFKFADGTSKILDTSRYYFVNSSVNQIQYYQKGINSETYSYLDHISKYNEDTSKYELQKHGTNVASTAASAINGNGGCVGIAPNAKLLIIKTDMQLSSIAEAVSYAASQNVDVINMSLGASSSTTTLNNAISNAYNKGIIVIAAAGNSNSSTNYYPASSSNVIGIGALASGQYEKASFSNYNSAYATATGNHNVDITAPGYVYAADETATLNGTTVSNRKHNFCNTQGTSFASPIVAGAAALWKQKNPNGTPAQFESELYASCDDIGSSGWDSTFGYGALNLKKLLFSTSKTATSMQIKAKNDKTTVAYGDHIQMYAQVQPVDVANRGVTWSSSNSTSLPVNSDTGVVNPTNVAGTAKIRATSKANSNVYAEIDFRNTTNEISSVSFTKDEYTIAPDSSGDCLVSFPVNVTPTNADKSYIEYTSSNEDILTCDDGEWVSAAEGDVTLTARSVFNSSIKDTCVVHISNSGGSTEDDNQGGSFEYGGSTKDYGSWGYTTAANGGTAPTDTRLYVKNKITLTSKSKAFKSVTITLNVNANSKGKFPNSATSDKGTLIGGTLSTGTNRVITINNFPSNTKEFAVTFGGEAGNVEIQTFDIVFEGGGSVTPTPTNYTVSFNSNGGTGTMADATTNGSTYVVPECTFSKTNYTFDKWALGSTSGTQYSVGDTISNISSNITLYALWTENQSTGGDDISYWTNWISSNQSALSTGGTTLVTALRNKIANVAAGSSNKLSYDDLWNAYAKTDGIPGSNGTRIYDMYGGFEFIKGTDQAGNYSKEGDKYNREHSVPKSWFSEHTPAYSDIIHVVPTDGKVNGMRSNNTFGEVNNASYSYSFPARSYNGVQYQKAGISKLGSPKAINGVTTSESVVFEPDDQYKGDFARIYMYFAVRYGNTTCSATTGSGAAIFTNTFTNANPYVTNYGLALIKKWHELDPVSEKEKTRNNAVEEVQGNRNPFVDYPEWADKIFGTNTTGGDTPTPTKTLSSIEVSNAKTSYTAGDSFVAPTVIATYSDNSTAPVTATFSGYNMNTVGTQTVTVSYTEGGVTKTTTYEITVSAATVAVTGVSLNSTSLELSVGEDATLVATVTPSNATNKLVTWESNNSSVATVSNGKVTAISEGNATITVKTVDGNKTATCTVKVNSSGGSDDDTTSKYVIEFSTVTTDESTVLSSDGLLGFTKTNTLATSFSGITRAYKGKNGVKFGSGSGGGGFTINLADGATSNIKKLSVYSTEYDSADKNISYSLGSIDGTFTAGEDFVKNFDNVSASTLSFATTKRAYISKIEIEVGTGSITPTTPEIKDISLDTTSKSIDLYGDSKTFSLTPTVTFVGDIDTTVTWSTSDSSVASISANTSANGVSITVTANKVGTATITATCGEKTATCVVTITDTTDVHTVKSLELVTSESTVPFMEGKGTYTVSARLIATFNDGHTEEVNPDTSNFVIRTDTLGFKEITASYGGLSASKEILVTNSQSDIGETTGGTLTETTTTTSHGSKVNEWTTPEGISISSDATGIGDDRGFQWFNKAAEITVKGYTNVKKVEVTVSANCDISSVTVTVGGVALGVEQTISKDYKNVKLLFANVTTDVSGAAVKANSDEILDGDIVIKASQGTKSFYLKSVDITSVSSSGGETHDATSLQQAIAWSNYFISLTNPICGAAPSGENNEALSEVWSTLQTEFGCMNSKSKELFLTSDDADIISARERYTHIINHYGNRLINFTNIEVASSNPLISIFDLDIFDSNNSGSIIIILFALTGITLLSSYFVIKRRKED